MNVVILAGGKGTRMGTSTLNIPKPMISLAGKPILEYQVELAKRYFLNDLIILTGYKHNVIKDYFKDGSAWGVSIQYSDESYPLGTSGAIKKIEDMLHEDFLVFYGDIIMDVDLESLISFHNKRHAIATVVVHPNDHPYDSDIVEINDENKVIAIHNKPDKKGAYLKNLVSAALYVLSPAILKYIEKEKYSDFGKDVFQKLIRNGEPIYAYITHEYIKDIGTKERLKEVEKDVLSSRVRKLNRENKQKAIFLDRDGVLNYEVNDLKNADKLKLLPGTTEAIKKINKSDYLSIVATNQPLIAKGFASEDDLHRIHAKLDTILGMDNTYIDRIYYCPHHPEKGFKGENKSYKIDCICRKPNTGMIKKATKEINIDTDASFIVGDRTVDIKTGLNSGLKTVLVRTGYAGTDGKYQCEPDFIFENLKESVDFILDKYNILVNKVEDILDNHNLSSLNTPIITVSGLSRSGKSTLTKIVSDAIKKRGLNFKILKLDNWLVSLDQREPRMTVRNRYKYDEILRDLKLLLERKDIKINKYDAKKRATIDRGETLVLNDEEILIIDGSVCLDIEFFRRNANIKIYTEVTEEERRERFYKFYKYKGLTNTEIKDLYLKREKDETPIILKTKKYADHVIRMENY